MCEVFILTYAEAKEYMYGVYSLIAKGVFLGFRGLLLSN